MKVPRVLNAEERAAAAEAERLAEEKRRLAALDNPRERGLIDMMDGKLEGKGVEEMWQEIPQPSFMTEIPGDTFVMTHPPPPPPPFLSLSLSDMYMHTVDCSNYLLQSCTYLLCISCM